MQIVKAEACMTKKDRSDYHERVTSALVVMCNDFYHIRSFSANCIFMLRVTVVGLNYLFCCILGHRTK